jgi:hypothetical protein
LSGDAEIIDAIILAGSVGIRAKDLHTIIRERELIEKKFQTISVGYHELRHQMKEIMLDARLRLSGEAAPPPVGDNLRCA